MRPRLQATLIAVAVLLLLLTALAAYSLVSGDGDASRPVGVPQIESPEAAVAGSGIGTVPAEPGAERVPALAMQQEADYEGPWIEVLVHDAVTKAPVAGATVLGHRKPFADTNMLSSEQRARFEAWRRRPTDELGVTNAEGKALVPEVRIDTLWARKGDLLGCVRFYQMHGPYEIPIAVDRGIAIRAIDADGRPVPELPLAVRSVLSVNEKFSALPAAIGLTDASGQLHVPICSLPREGVLVPWVPGAWHRGGLSYKIDPAQQQVLELVVPPLGSLRFAYADPEDARFARAGLLELVEEYASAGTVEDPCASWHWMIQIPTEGQATLRYCGLGINIEGRLGEFSAAGAGPAQAGELAVVLLRRAEDPEACGVYGRLLWPDGNPVAEQDIVVAYRANRAMGRPTLRTDRDGVFRLLMGGGAANWRLDWLLLQSGAASAEGLPLVCLHQPGVELRPGHLDLGDLTLAPAAVLVEGRIDCAVPDFDYRRTTIGVEVGMPGADGSLRWRDLEWVVVQTKPAADGRFCICSPKVTGPVRLSVQHPQAQDFEPLQFLPGTRDLTVHLSIAGSLIGKLEVNQDILPMVWVRLSNDDHAVESFGRAWFAWQGLNPGSYTLEAFLGGEHEPLAVIKDVMVVAGMECKDP